MSEFFISQQRAGAWCLTHASTGVLIAAFSDQHAASRGRELADAILSCGEDDLEHIGTGSAVFWNALRHLGFATTGEADEDGNAVLALVA